jgi:hypothetical protein
MQNYTNYIIGFCVVLALGWLIYVLQMPSSNQSAQSEDGSRFGANESAYATSTESGEQTQLATTSAQSKMDNKSNSETIESMSKQLKTLSAVSELSTYIKTSIDMRDDSTKAVVEKDFLASLPPLIELYKGIKDQNFNDKRYVDDFFSKVKLYIHIQKNVNL